MLLDQREESLSRLLFAIEQGWRCAAIIGPPGSGRSRLLRDVQRTSLRRNTVLVSLDAAGMTRTEFAERLTAEATGTYRPATNSWQHLADVLHGWHATETASLWVIDNADDLSEDVLRLIGLMDHAHVSATVMVALADRRWLSDAIELVVSLDRHHAAAAA